VVAALVPVFEPAAVEDVGIAVPLRTYKSSLFPAPQYSRTFPAQIMLQSPAAALVELAATALPQ